MDEDPWGSDLPPVGQEAPPPLPEEQQLAVRGWRPAPDAPHWL